ncbi:MFS transporter [Streptomyces sp. CA-253872]|uniref:MFS transporter n=1 Tax=Streptomyces sp. CA-253872 TaxID=3240067 RepID=UPI003D910166
MKDVKWARPQASSGERPGLVLAAVAVVQFMVSLDLSVVNVGLPEIAKGLGFGVADLTWVIHAYALAFGGLLLLGGKAADRYGRKRVLVTGLALFGAASSAGGFAQAPGQLIAARAAQGIGAAALAPAALALLTSTFPTGRARVRAFGVWSAVNAAGGALGVLAGGLLTQYAGWRWVMFLNVPMAAVALALAWRGIANDRTGVRGGGTDSRGDGTGVRRGGTGVRGARAKVPGDRPDVLGAVLATSGLFLLVLGVVRTDRNGWGSPVTLATLALSVLLLAAFLVVERTTAREPLLRIGLFAHRSVAGANVFNLLVGAGMATAFYFVSLYAQRVLGNGAAVTGLMFLPFALGVVAGSVLAVTLGYRFAARTILVCGSLLTALGLGWFGLISADGGFLTDILGPSLVASVGFGLCLGPVVSVATADVAPHEAGTASGLLNSSRQIGASLGLAALSTAATHRTGASLGPHHLTQGYAFALTLSAAVLAAATLTALTIPRRTPPKPPAVPALPERETAPAD